MNQICQAKQLGQLPNSLEGGIELKTKRDSEISLPGNLLGNHIANPFRESLNYKAEGEKFRSGIDIHPYKACG